MTPPIEPLILVPHPRHVPADIRRVTVRVLGIDDEWLRLRWRVDGAQALVLPLPMGANARADGLWRTTCFEAFVMPEEPFDTPPGVPCPELVSPTVLSLSKEGSGRTAGGGRTRGGRSEVLPGHPVENRAYVELNLSPNGRWNAYDFTAYRSGMTPRPSAHAPKSSMRIDDNDDHVLTFDAAVPSATLPTLPCLLGLCAVLEEQGGIKSYWALAHPSTDAPDFHAAASFTTRIEPPSSRVDPAGNPVRPEVSKGRPEVSKGPTRNTTPP